MSARMTDDYSCYRVGGRHGVSVKRRIDCLSLTFKAGVSRPLLVSARLNHPMASQSSPQSVHDFTVKDARGNDVDLSIYKGKVLLIVNIASQCGLNGSNYTELTQLYEKYKNQGFEILAFPCNQLGFQEPGSSEEIEELARTRFKAEYPIFDKVEVNGNNAAPIYKFLKSSKGGPFWVNIKYNFSKFLVDKDGRVVERHTPLTSPVSVEIVHFYWVHSMISYRSRLLSQKNIYFASLSASYIFSKPSSFNPKQTLLPSLHNSPLSLLSQSIKARVSRPLLGSVRLNHSMASQSSPQSVHDFTVKDARGNDVDLSIYKGKVLLIVNVASQCGLTDSNYTELTQLYEKYKNQGFEILAFPCNQFGSQEPGSSEEIVEFACTRFKAEYPIFDKVEVNGNNAAPIYKFLKSSKGGLFGDNIKWNFSKFLVDKDGNVVERHAPTTSPLSIEKHVKKLLGIA
ncbi:hypothetical protein SADUNF_Sadunf03G0093400 [Salix dunnii]|uniref:Glutathione peroxidase n=1 Tax=Salix dunnii TaxID=1413687 RepID=A0A835K7Z4_9ROSI|nr:hypothetical protein SADUNF_Sadunf03G0093400 [Salix dunnii]